MNFKSKLTLLVIFSQIIITQAQTKIVNYLNTPNPLKIENTDYNLVWSAHPNQNYYKQEYLTSDQTLEKYKKMVLIEFVQGDFKVENVLQQKINELENLKKQNPIINYKVYNNNGEYILDFLMSANSPDGKSIKIIERNIYRYKIITSNNKNGLLLFAISERGYENDIDAFFDTIKSNTSKLIETVANFTLPKIEIE